MNAVLRAALEYVVERGWRVLPVTVDKEPNWPLLEATRDKKRWGGLRDEPADADEVRDWFRLDPTTGIAVICGNGLAVVDVDRGRSGFAGNAGPAPTAAARSERSPAFARAATSPAGGGTTRKGKTMKQPKNPGVAAAIAMKKARREHRPRTTGRGGPRSRRR